MSLLPPARLVIAAVVPVLAVACTGAPTADPPSPAAPTTSGTTDEATTAGPPTPTTSPTPTPPSPSPSEPTAPDPDAPVESASELSMRLVAAEEAIRHPDTSPEALARWAQVQQAAYRALSDHPGWVDEVAASVPDDLREAFEANLHGQQELFALTEPREELPDWRIVPAPPADELRAHYRAAGEEFGIDWSYLAAIHLVESRMGRIRGDSHAGAQGPMQFLPSTWDAYGEGDIQDPGDAITAAARYLADHGAPQDMDGALWAYNHSDRYVAAIQAYAGVMRDEPETYEAYYHWRIYYRMQDGDVVLEEGWEPGEPPTTAP